MDGAQQSQSTEPLQRGILLLTTESPGVAGTHLIDLQGMESWANCGYCRRLRGRGGGYSFAVTNENISLTFFFRVFWRKASFLYTALHLLHKCKREIYKLWNLSIGSYARKRRNFPSVAIVRLKMWKVWPAQLHIWLFFFIIRSIPELNVLSCQKSIVQFSSTCNFLPHASLELIWLMTGRESWLLTRDGIAC